VDRGNLPHRWTQSQCSPPEDPSSTEVAWNNTTFVLHFFKIKLSNCNKDTNSKYNTRWQTVEEVRSLWQCIGLSWVSFTNL
jgi:hypothetical protein